MLNSLQIEALLLQHGFTLAEENAHAVGYRHPSLPELVYLKEGRKFLKDPRKAVAAQPMVLHPKHIGGSLQAWLKESYQAKLVYKNSNLRSFPKYLGSESNYGVALGIRDAVHLTALLQRLGVVTVHETPVGRGAVTDTADAEDADIAQAKDLPSGETEQLAVIAARQGQGLFRKLLDDYWGACAVTGFPVREVLRASHIKPWACSSNAERLDPFNGLLLSAHLDAAFDQGLISFADDGQLLLNPERLPATVAAKLGISSSMRLRKLEAAHRVFLRHHRAAHGFPV